ncbi:MAG: sugar-binding protein, partial [Pseudomonas sp.]
DGLGRTVEEIDALGHSTGYRYDAFDRMVESTLPDKTVVIREYALHSTGDLPTLISVDDRVLGEQSFDGLDRMYSSISGGREQVFTFESGQTRPKTVTTASAQVIEYTYLPMLGEEPLIRRIPASDTTANYTYDPHNARLLYCSELDQQLTREYYSTGELMCEVRTQGADTYNMHYSYSLSGRLRAYTDVLGQTQLYEYDTAGRLNKTTLGQTVSTFSYNAQGQTQSIKTVDGAQSVTINLEYDDLGREVKRTFEFSNVTQTLAQSYNEVDALVTRILEEGTAVLRDETFGYDTRGRLANYTCKKGSQPPVDPYGKSILSQSFRFDARDNLTLVLTTFEGGSNRATYTYAETDPTQLIKIVNSHDDYAPKIIELSYDPDGNLIVDEQGRTLSYDALGRLTEVSGPSANSQYRYDPLDKLSSYTGDSGQDQRFYREGELANQLRGEQHSTFVRGSDYLLAEQQGG